MAKSQPFAHGTTVPPEKTRMEIEQTLQRYGATGFAFMSSAERARIEFLAKQRRVRFDLVFPVAKASWERNKVEAETRRLWRAMLLGIKSKLEVVRSGISVFGDEFLAHIVMPDGSTVGEHVRPQIAESYKSGKVLALLPAGGAS